MNFIRIILALFILLISTDNVNGDCNREIRRSPEYQEALAKGAVARICLSVIDENGTSVSNAIVKAVFDMTTFANNVEGRTDARGICTIESKTRGNSIMIGVEKKGYYKSEKKLCLIGFEQAHAVMNGFWQPSPMNIPLQLRKKHSPAEMVSFADFITAPATNTWFGFDLKDRQLSKPYGAGEHADIEFYVEWDGLTPPRSKHCSLSLRYADQSAGGSYYKLATESKFPYTYMALDTNVPLNANIEVIDRNGDPHVTGVPFQKNAEFVFRSRCKFDHDGKLIAANYGSIRRLEVGPSWNANPAIWLVYIFNPQPNNRNLETK